ncbi:MAG: LamG domain-containing protein [bacterium]
MTIWTLTALPCGADVVGFWTFDDIQNGVIPDHSGNGLYGFLGRQVDDRNDPTSTDNTPSGLPEDRAIHLNGKGGIVVGDYERSILNLSSGEAITMEVWLYPEEQITDWTGLVQYGQWGQGYKMGIRGNGELLFTLLGVVDISTPTIVIEPDGQWHHLAVSYEPGAGVTFFHNGEETDWVEERHVMVTPTAKELWIGCEQGAKFGFSGTIDRVRISKALLAPGQLDSDPEHLRQSGETTIFYAPFDEPSPPYLNAINPDLMGVTSGQWLTTTKVPDIMQDTPSDLPGDFSLYVDGTGEIVHIPDPGGLLNFSDQDFTIEVWVKYVDIPFDPSRLIYYGEGGKGYGLSIGKTSGRLQLDHKGLINAIAQTALVPGDGRWHHIAAVNLFSEGMVYFYIDGELAEILDNPGKVFPAVELPMLFVGARQDSREGYAGYLDRVRISNTALAADDLDSEPIGASLVDWALLAK